jgi:hypothetical protein
MPSIRSRPAGPKYGKKTYFGYSRWHQVHMNFRPSPPPSPHVAELQKMVYSLEDKKLFFRRRKNSETFSRTVKASLCF